MDEYLCITLLSKPSEAEAGFASRLSAFWTHMLRNHESDFEKIYAESSAFEKKDDARLGRKYLIESDVATRLAAQLKSQSMEFEPIDDDEVYSKFEATPPEWFWIEH